MAPYLVSAGYDVTGLDSFLYQGCTFLNDEITIPSIRKDIRDVTKSDLEGFDAIVHLAGLCNDPLGALSEAWTYEINHSASVRLARLAKRAHVRKFLFASSCSMYGSSSTDTPVDEEAPLRPLTAYATSKIRTETDLGLMADDSFSPVYMRNATAYGVSPRLRADVVLNNLVCWAHTTGQVRVTSDGNSWRPIVHVEDISQAFSLVLGAASELIRNQAFNIGVNGHNYQVRDLAEFVREVVPNSETQYSGEVGADPRSYRVDFSKFTAAFPGYEPRWNPLRGARQLYSAFCDFNLTFDQFQGQKYIRLNQLRYLIQNGHLDESLRWRAA